MKLTAYCKANDHSFELWRAWRGVERGWRAALGKPVVKTTVFVKAVAQGALRAGGAASIRITVQRDGVALRAIVEVPEGALRRCAALLREVLA